MRIKPLAGYPFLVRLIFWAQRKKYGEVLLPARIWGRSPKLFYGLQCFYRAIDRKSSPIEPALRALINVKVSQINHCAFCVDISSSLLEKRGVSAEKIAALPEFMANPLFSPRERVALAYAVAVTLPERRVDDALFQELRKEFSEDEVVELTALIGYQNLSSKFNAALDVPPQGFCPANWASNSGVPRPR